MTEKRTIKGWAHYLETPDAKLTLSEFMALCLLHIRENCKDARLGTQHLEGMVGTLDEFMAGDDRYRAIAAKRARPVPMLPEQDVS